MPKITTHGGPSFVQEEPPAGPVAAGPADSEPAAPPPVSALKAEHVEYAVEALDVPPETAESMTKAELVELARAPEPEPAPEPRKAPTLSRTPVEE